jgi:hypothetical protein
MRLDDFIQRFNFFLSEIIDSIRFDSIRFDSIRFDWKRIRVSCSID